VAPEAGSNRSVERAVAVLRAFAVTGSLRVTEVANLAGLRQSTASRLLSTLESAAFVERDADGQYRLGAELITLAGVAVNGHPVHHAARQPAQSLAAATGLGANVAVRRGHEAYYLCNFEGRLAPRAFSLTGRRNPLHATALGKCLLLGVDDRRALLGELERYTPRTITDHDTLDAAIEQVAWQGYSTETEELSLSRSCLAAPLRDRSGHVVGALSLSGPSSAVDLATREHELSRLVVETADAINSHLGHHGPTDPQLTAPPGRLDQRSRS
jgi:DNA-binding IclR family transcriptional regulator